MFKLLEIPENKRREKKKEKGQCIENLFLLLFCNFADVDDCNPNMCQNAATCVDEPFEYTCLCADGFEGINCQIGK